MADDLNGMDSTASEEFDFSQDGIVEAEHEWTITAFEVVTKAGKGVQHKLTFEAQGMSFPVSVGYWIEHTNPKATQAGRSELKRIATAALGQPKYTPQNIVGATVLATVSEDTAGYTRLGKFKPSVKAVEAVAGL